MRSLARRTLLAAGSNAKGQLGICSYDDAHIFTPCQFAECAPNALPDSTLRVAQITCGANHTVLLLKCADGSTTLWGAGDGRRGQLGPAHHETTGDSDKSPWTIFRPLVLPLPNGYATRGDQSEGEYNYKMIAAAWETTYVVLSHPAGSDVLLSMGSDEFGALGLGEVLGSASLDPNEPRIIDFGHIFADDFDDGHHVRHKRICIQSVHAGPRHVVAQLIMTIVHADRDGTSSSHSRTVLVGWGASRHGQLGPHGGMRYIARPTSLPINVNADPMVSCALGNQHTVILHASGCLSAFGSNKRGQLPSLNGNDRPPRPIRISEIGCTWNGTYLQGDVVEGDTDRRVLFSTGNGAQGQLGRGSNSDVASTSMGAIIGLAVDRTLSEFVCGSEHVLVTMSSTTQEVNSVFGWGWNEHGNMGLGSLRNVTMPTLLWPREDVGANHEYPQRVVGIWAGCATSWLLVE